MFPHSGGYTAQVGFISTINPDWTETTRQIVKIFLAYAAVSPESSPPHKLKTLNTKKISRSLRLLEIFHIRSAPSLADYSQGSVGRMLTHSTFSHFHSLVSGLKVELTKHFQFSSSQVGKSER